jgi:hypothetical protein
MQRGLGEHAVGMSWQDLLSRSGEAVRAASDLLQVSRVDETKHGRWPRGGRMGREGLCDERRPDVVLRDGSLTAGEAPSEVSSAARMRKRRSSGLARPRPEPEKPLPLLTLTQYHGRPRCFHYSLPSLFSTNETSLPLSLAPWLTGTSRSRHRTTKHVYAVLSSSVQRTRIQGPPGPGGGRYSPGQFDSSKVLFGWDRTPRSRLGKLAASLG